MPLDPRARGDPDGVARYERVRLAASRGRGPPRRLAHRGAADLRLVFNAMLRQDVARREKTAPTAPERSGRVGAESTTELVIKAKDMSDGAFTSATGNLKRLKGEAADGSSSFGRMEGSLRQFDDVLHSSAGRT